MDANSHPIRVQTVKGEDFFANSHPYKVTIVGGGGQEARVVDELPEEGEAGYIYLVLKETTSEGDIYDEYIWALQQDGETYGWEHIGATNEVKIEIDDALSDTSENAVQNKVIKGALDNKLDNTTTFWGRAVSNGAVNGNITMTDNTSIGTSNNNGVFFYTYGSGSVTVGSAGQLLLRAGSYQLSYSRNNGALNGIQAVAAVTDATNKRYVDNLVISYAALSGSTAPTTATEGKYVGQLYLDTTNDDLYYLSTIDTTATPATYTWTKVGGGTLYNTYGQNTDGAMTQKATTDLVYTGGDPKKINIGDNSVTGGTNSIIIGSEDSGTITAATDQIIIGHNITDSSQETIAIGHNVSVGGKESVCIGDSSRSGNSGVAIGRNAQAGGDNSVAIGSGGTWQTMANGNSAIAIGFGARALGAEGITIGFYPALQTSTTASARSVIIGGRTNVTGTTTTAGTDVVIGYGGTVSGIGSVALGAYSSTPLNTQGVVGIGTTNTAYGYNNTNYRLLTGVHDGEQDHDAVTVGQLNTAIINGGTTAPTTSTVGAVGTLYSYVDTTGTTPTPVLSVCTAVDTTDPSNPTYTWTDLLGPIEQALNQINSGTGV